MVSRGHGYCRECKQVKPWFRFRIGQKDENWSICFSCERYGKDGLIKHKIHKEDPIRLEIQLHNLINSAMKNKMVDLRNHLFETLEKVKDNDMEPHDAKVICQIAQVIINSAKVEVDFLRVAGLNKSEFMQIEDKKEG